MKRTISLTAFLLGAALALWVAARGADQLLQAYRLSPALGDATPGVWMLLGATFCSIVLSLAAILLAWRARRSERLGVMMVWLLAGAVVSPALVEAAAWASERL